MQVGALNATLGLFVDKEAWRRGEAQIDHFRRLALATGAFFASKWLGGALIGFNRNIEDSKNQIAGMMAFAKKTLITEELQNANTLYDMLRNKARSLPGDTEDYVNMLGLITNPLTKAGATLQEMSDITAHAFVLAKAFGGTWQEAGRDVRDFLNTGQLYARDKFLRTILNPLGYDANDESRAKLAKMGIKQRLALLKQAIDNPTAKSIEERLQGSMGGRIDTLKDTLKQTAGKAGEALFNSLKTSITQLTAWLDANQERISAWAYKIGGYINTGFGYIKDAILWLADHKDVALSALGAIGVGFLVLAGRAAYAWAASAAPLVGVGGLIWIFLKLREYTSDLTAAVITLGIAIAAAFAYKKINAWINGIKSATSAVSALSSAQAAAGMSSAGSFVNSAGPGFPAGASQHPQGAVPAGGPGFGMFGGMLGFVGIAASIATSLDALTNASSKYERGAGRAFEMLGMDSKENIDKLMSLGLLSSADVRSGYGSVIQGDTTINVYGAKDADDTAAKVKAEVDKRDAEARAAYRAGTGNRSDE